MARAASQWKSSKRDSTFFDQQQHNNNEMNTPTPTPTPTCGEISCEECNARTAALTAEVKRLRSDRDCEKRLRKDADELREDAIERAELAKAERDQLRAEVDLDEELQAATEKSLKIETIRAERAEVSKLTDALDMMRDEFMRIIACPGCNAEIEDLANRAQLKLIQRVPVITQRDRAEAELATERARLDWLERDAGVDWQWSDDARLVSRASIDAFMKEETK